MLACAVCLIESVLVHFHLFVLFSVSLQSLFMVIVEAEMIISVVSPHRSFGRFIITDVLYVFFCLFEPKPLFLILVI